MCPTRYTSRLFPTSHVSLFFSLTSLLPSLYLACVPIWFGLIWFGRLSYPISACVYAPCNRTTAVGLTCALAVLRKHQAPHHGLILSHFQAQTCHGLFKMILPDTAPASLDLDSLTHLVMHPFPPSIACLWSRRHFDTLQGQGGPRRRLPTTRHLSRHALQHLCCRARSQKRFFLFR